jgi:hypothetical protein
MVRQKIMLMDGCLMDGLDPDESRSEDGDLPPPKEKSNG